MRSRSLPAGALFAAALAARLSSAETSGSSSPGAPAEPKPERKLYEVEFEAGHVELDGSMQRLEMSDDVVVRVDRYRLTSQRLKLYRGPRGIVVDGQGRVAFCPCSDPPITVGFSAATVAPPTDLLIQDPTLRIGGVPIFWLPYLWLRSPDRIGLLPPRLAWRGDDGLLAGAGVHLPLGKTDQGISALDVNLAGYLQGGVELDTRLATRQSSTHVRWDHLHESLLAIDAHGADSNRGGGTVAWRVDAIRGERGRRGTLLLEQAARRYDRAESSVGQADEGAVFGLGAVVHTPRAGELDDVGAIGPFAEAGFGSALGSVGAVDTSLMVGTSNHAAFGSITRVMQRGELRLDARPGPFALNGELRQDVLGSTQEVAGGASDDVRARAGATLELRLPMMRAYGRAENALVHRVEPFTELGGLVSVERRPTLGRALDEATELVRAAGGLRNSLGRYADRDAGTFEVQGGWIGRASAPVPALAGHAGLDTQAFALVSDAAIRADQPDSAVAAARTRLGRVDALHLSGYVEGRLELEPELARWLVEDAWDAPETGWLDRSGWSAGAELGVPWADWLATAAALDYDLTARELLAVRGSVGYRHRCQCLAALAWAGHRLGREGFDAWFTLDLMP